jgi:outer membrane biosynthesis protein TonB
MKYPVEAAHYGAEGRVVVRFFVEKDGTVSEPQVIKTDFKNRLSDKKFRKRTDAEKEAMREHGESQLKAEALRVVAKMNNWEPAMRRGKKARVKYTIPIVFKLK